MGEIITLMKVINFNDHFKLLYYNALKNPILMPAWQMKPQSPISINVSYFFNNI